MKTLSTHDLHQCIRFLPKQLKEYIMLHPQIKVAGGYIRGVISKEPMTDVDLFAGNQEVSQVMAYDLTKDAKKVHKTDNALTIKIGRTTVQFITRWVFDNSEDCIKSFDFTVCQAAFWYDQDYKKWNSICSDDFYPDLAAKRLIYTWPIRDEEPGGSMLRVLKYYQKGYRIPLDSLAAVIARLMKGVDWVKILGGINRKTHDGTFLNDFESKYLAKILAGLLFEVDPNAFIDHEAYFPRAEELVNCEEEVVKEII